MISIKKKTRYAVIGVVLVAGLAGYGLLRPSKGAAASQPAQETATVKRGELAISIETTGQFQSAKSVPIYPEIEWGGTIIYVIEEGKEVKKGDVLCKLDNPNIRENDRNSEVELERHRAEIAQETEQQRMTEAASQKNIAAAELTLALARMAKDQYGEVRLTTDSQLDEAAYTGDSPLPKGEAYQSFRDASLKIESAVNELQRAQNDFQGMDVLLAKGFTTKADYDKTELAVLEAERKLESARLAYDILKSYSYPRSISDYDIGIKDAENALEKTKIQAGINAVRGEVRVKNAQLTFDHHKQRMDETEQEKAHLVITAPVDGVVVYGDPDQPWWREHVRVGQSVWRQMRLFTIPDTSSYLVKTRVLEMDVFKVKPGQAAIVTSQALQGATLKAKVKSVSENAQSDWRGMDKWKYYDVYVDLDQADSRIKAGMSCNIELVLDRLSDVTYVPVASVFNTGDKHTCYVVTSSGNKAVEVETGQASEKYVVIKKGLEPGQTVLLAETAPSAASKKTEAEKK
jgi:HlyD family secretion protein